MRRKVAAILARSLALQMHAAALIKRSLPLQVAVYRAHRSALLELPLALQVAVPRRDDRLRGVVDVLWGCRCFVGGVCFGLNL